MPEPTHEYHRLPEYMAHVDSWEWETSDGNYASLIVRRGSRERDQYFAVRTEEDGVHREVIFLLTEKMRERLISALQADLSKPNKPDG